MIQEAVAFFIVLTAALYLGRGFFRTYLARPLSALLLKKGRVGWAMRLKIQAPGTSCGGCQSSCTPKAVKLN